MTDYSKLFDLNGRVALVVGAGSGIGQAAAQGLAAYGAHVHCADVSLDAAEATATTIRDAGGAGNAIHLDMHYAGMVAETFDHIGWLDVLVTTPSVNVRKPICELSEAEFDRIISLNLKGTFLLMRAAGRCMASQGRGSIIALSSIRCWRAT